MNKAHIKLLKENYEKACNAYVSTLLELWGLDAYYGFWIADEVGGLYDYGCGCFTISMSDIVYCVEKNIKYNDFLELTEYNIKCCNYNLSTMNINSWFRGAPRHDFTKLDALKKDLDDAIENEKNKF